MSKKLLVIIGILIVILVGAFFFLRNSNNKVSTAVPTGPVQEVNISAKEFAYTPSTVSVSKGQAVKINFTNQGTTTHNMVIQGLNVQTKSIQPGESDSVTFTPVTPGTYTFYCSIDSHRSLGLTGTLEVK